MRRRILAIWMLCLLLPWASFAESASGSAEPIWISTSVKSPVSKEKPHWAFPYSDALFDAPATAYNHQLAQSSLGLAVAAFRQKDEELPRKDIMVRDYLTAAGFTSLASEEYDITPSIDTVATMIARKQIGDTTLIAVAVSGGDYEKEWQSNFTISAARYNDDEVFHDGFANAAAQVLIRVLLYIKEQEITGPTKIWLTGYSRAAAVSNLVALGLLESDTVADDALYAYTFATPRCMTGEIARDCPGVFNIVGSFDPVPAVPFAEWGYNRYGNTLFLPAQELCDDYPARKAAVQPVYRKLTGLDYWNNPQANWLCCKAMQVLDEVMFSADDYRSALQQIIIDAMNMTGGTISRLRQIYRMVDQNGALKELLANARFSADGLISAFAYSLMRQKLGQEADLWNHDVSVAAELIHEHCPDVYIAWMFSQDDPEDLFISCLEYHQLAVSGDVKVSISDAQGRALAAPAGFRLGDTQLLTIPAEKDHTVTLTAQSDTNTGLLVLERTAQCLYGRVLLWSPIEGAPLQAGDVLTLAIPAGEGKSAEAFALTGTTLLTFSTDTMELDINDSFAMMELVLGNGAATDFLERALWVAGIAAVVLLALLVLLIVLLCRRVRRKRRAAQAMTEAALAPAVPPDDAKNSGSA